ncbi:MAG: hypothetical protein ACI8PG_005212, partial [Planctomycetota bacterium]
LAGEVRRPTLIAHWSNGGKHRLGERAHWTSSDSTIIRITHDDALYALAPGHSSITARLGEHSIPPYHLKVTAVLKSFCLSLRKIASSNYTAAKSKYLQYK